VDAGTDEFSEWLKDRKRAISKMKETSSLDKINFL
jgi:hypothetical protein